ncbi:WD repeat domain 62 [Elysia marginata]|uniref:WD repeat domain 62 n=1 Tax=Elysia marginata TaxID=1093978 RepID=A0AAV4ERB2_9GAST|nr:WD repeat domain 62 [Elysia marginata]
MLDNLKENCFCDVACGQGDNCYVFVVTTSGILCQINSNRFLERWVNVNMPRASSLSTDGQHVFVGGCQGSIRMFNAADLKIVISSDGDLTESPIDTRKHLPNVSASENSAVRVKAAATEYISPTIMGNDCSDHSTDKGNEVTQEKRHPGVVALTFDPRHQNLTVVYEDHSLYIWARGSDPRRDSESFCFQKR